MNWQDEQKKVATGVTCGQEPVAICEHCEKERPVIHAPQREWVGLTDDEVVQCQQGDIYHFYRCIEIKLREKNLF